MSVRLNDNSQTAVIGRHLSKAQAENADAMEKLSSGQVFTRADPHPSERALAEGLEFRLRSLSSAKSNINTGISLLQTAESALSEVNNMILRMKEINIAASTTTLSDRDRRFLFVEYEALHDEINRIAKTTEFNGLPLLNGQDERMPKELLLRVGDPVTSETIGLGTDDEDLNVITFKDLQNVVATTAGLGLKSARQLLSENPEDGIAVEDVLELMAPDIETKEATSYDAALSRIADIRAQFGAYQARLSRSMDFIDVFQENIAAAKSSIADVDYAQEVSRMVKSRMLVQAGTAMLAQSNISTQLALNLLKAIGT
jgi:flagellin